MFKEIGEVTQSRSSSGGWNMCWKIKNVFSFLANKDTFRSPDLPIADYNTFTFCLNVNAHPRIDIGFWLKPEMGEKPRMAIVSFGVKTANGEVQKIGYQIIAQSCDFFLIAGVLSVAELQKRSREIAPSGELTFTCDIILQDVSDSDSEDGGPQNTPHADPGRAGEDPQHLSHQQQPQAQNSSQRGECQGVSQLCTNFKEMFLSRKFCDATLKVQDEEFSVHRCVLSVRSPVFEAMFEADMKEKRTGVVDIPDCQPRAFRDFLTYIYCGAAEDLSQNAIDLYRIADKYGVEELRRDCLDYVMNNLSVDNLFDAAILGHQFGERELNGKVQDFFNENFKELVRQANWSSFLKDHFALGNEMLTNMSDKI